MAPYYGQTMISLVGKPWFMNFEVQVDPSFLTSKGGAIKKDND